MARCERCGTNFDYEKREGICPKCCYYNRPPGAARQDNEWMKHYNVEDNSYQLPKVEGQEAVHSQKKRLDRNSAYQKKNQKRTSYYRTEKKREKTLFDWKKIIGAIFLVWVIVVFVIVLLNVGESDFIKQMNGNQVEEKTLLQVKNISAEEAAAGIEAGDVTYRIGEVKTLFREGELSEIPPGEKCIGIWIEDNESVIQSYTGYDWERPYVFDGTNFREMIDIGILQDDHLFEEKAIETFPYYNVGYEDVKAFAIYFIDADATTVTLSLPCQKVDQQNTDEKEYSQVLDVRLPINES